MVTSEEKLQARMLSKDDGTEMSDPRAMVTSALVADPGFLAFAVRQCIEAQALLEHFAVVLGVE